MGAAGGGGGGQSAYNNQVAGLVANSSNTSCLLYTSPSQRDQRGSSKASSA